MRVRLLVLVFAVGVGAVAACSSSSDVGGGGAGGGTDGGPTLEGDGDDGGGPGDATSDGAPLGDGGGEGGADGGCVPLTHWVQETNDPVASNGVPAKIAADCDGVYTLAATDTAYRLQKWNQTDGTNAWTVPLAVDAASVSTYYPALALGNGALYTTSPAYATIEKHDRATGAQAWSVKDASMYQICAVAADASALYTVAATGSYPSFGYRLDKRSPVDGSVEWSATLDDSYCAGGSTYGNALVARPDALYLLGRSFERRSLVDGALVWRADTYEPVDLAVGDTAAFTVGATLPSGNGSFYEWHVQRWELADGGPGWSKSFEMSENNDSADTAAISGDALYVAGFQRTQTFSPTVEEWHVVRLDPATGTTAWDRSVSSMGEDQPFAATADRTAVYVAGRRGGKLRVEKREPAAGGL